MRRYRRRKSGALKDTVCIVGSHPRTRAEMDFTRTDCDIWVFNEALSTEWATRADGVFQMHEEAIWKNPQNRNDPKHYGWLTTQTETPVYMQATYTEVPMSEAYPLDGIVTELLPHLTKQGEPVKYFASSIDYALALAIYKGYKRIEVYGVELETQTEYTYQRTGFGLWVGMAAGRGIEVDLHVGIFDFPLYGYEGEVVLDYHIFDGRINELAPIVDTIKEQYEKQKAGSEAAFDKFIESGSRADAEEFMKLLNVQKELGQQLSRIDGALQENQRYKGKADAMKEASGEFLFSRQEFEGAAKDMQARSAKALADSNVAGGRCEVIFTELVRTNKVRNRKRKANEFLAQIGEHLRHLFYSALYMGAFEENHRFMSTLDAHIKAAGGAKSEAVLLEAMNQ